MDGIEVAFVCVPVACDPIHILCRMAVFVLMIIAEALTSRAMKYLDAMHL